MPIPDTPQTRQEQYLNAIATGDASGIPDTPKTREEMYLDEIARNGGGGSSSLPEVTAADNGDVLTVVEGAWAKAAPSGGGGVLVCNVDMQTMTLDKTWQEIHDAGFAVVVGLSSGAKQTMPVLTTADDNGEYLVLCESSRVNGGTRVPVYRTFVADASDGYPVAQMG